MDVGTCSLFQRAWRATGNARALVPCPGTPLPIAHIEKSCRACHHSRFDVRLGPPRDSLLMRRTRRNALGQTGVVAGMDMHPASCQDTRTCRPSSAPATLHESPKESAFACSDNSQCPPLRRFPVASFRSSTYPHRPGRRQFSNPSSRSVQGRRPDRTAPRDDPHRSARCRQSAGSRSMPACFRGQPARR